LAQQTGRLMPARLLTLAFSALDFRLYEPQARAWPLPSAVWKLEPQAQDLVALGLKIEKPLFMMSST
jgi:hypothetical protein